MRNTKRNLRSAIFFTGILFSGTSVPLYAQEVWVSRTSGTSIPLLGVAWTGSAFVAVSSSLNDSLLCQALTSPDGLTWTLRTAGKGNGLRAVTLGAGGLLVAVGSIGVIKTSMEGITWGNSISGTSTLLNAIYWTGTQFVAVGVDGTILIGPDGTKWVSSYSGVSYSLLSAASGNGVIVVSGSEGTITSPSGAGGSWTSVTSQKVALNAMVWTGSKFVGASVDSGVYTSSDGLTWTRQITNNSFKAFAWTGSLVVGVGNGGQIATSSDGVTWTSRTSGTTEDLTAVTFSANTLVVVGRRGKILTSELQTTGIRAPAGGVSRVPQMVKPIPGTIQGYRANGRKPAAIQTSTP
jgi:hypothetical protein